MRETKKETRGGARFYTRCEGSYEHSWEDKCFVCGKEVQRTINGYLLRHKPLSKVVQQWRKDEQVDERGKEAGM